MSEDFYWVGDFLHLTAGGDVGESFELAELLRIGLLTKLDGDEQRTSAIVANFLQEHLEEQAQSTRNESIVTDVMQHRFLFEVAGSQPIGADCVLRYLEDVLNQKDSATDHLADITREFFGEKIQ